MQVANLGDSGVRVIRDGRIVFASAAQQHMFNMPYQVLASWGCASDILP